MRNAVQYTAVARNIPGYLPATPIFCPFLPLFRRGFGGTYRVLRTDLRMRGTFCSGKCYRHTTIGATHLIEDGISRYKLRRSTDIGVGSVYVEEQGPRVSVVHSCWSFGCDLRGNGGSSRRFIKRRPHNRPQ